MLPPSSPFRAFSSAPLPLPPADSHSPVRISHYKTADESNSIRIRRQSLCCPYSRFVSDLCRMARHRIELIKQYGSEFADLLNPAITREHDYELRRHEAVFHAEWIFDEEETERTRLGHTLPLRISFRELCTLLDLNGVGDCCSSSGLSVEDAREMVFRGFSRDAVQSLLDPVNWELMEITRKRWMMAAPATEGWTAGDYRDGERSLRWREEYARGDGERVMWKGAGKGGKLGGKK